MEPSLDQLVFIEKIKKPLALYSFFFQKIPTLFWWGAKLEKLDSFEATVMLPYNWRTQNPFKSIYFAAQSGAAELASGLLATMSTEGKVSVSTLVTEVSGSYIKKANQPIYFTCIQGEEIRKVVLETIADKIPKSIQTKVVGTFKDGTIVSSHLITWSFKSR
ncbi:MAG: hypothetical protein RLZZ417_1316 [Bacteroidota bacterium]|jgi:hypothetical protein